MSYATATVLGFGIVVFFLYTWQRDLPRNTVWNIGLKYVFKGVTIGLMLPVLAYLTRIQAENTTGDVTVLQSIVETVYSVSFWLFVIVLFFLVLGFTFDMLEMRKVNA